VPNRYLFQAILQIIPKIPKNAEIPTNIFVNLTYLSRAKPIIVTTMPAIARLKRRKIQAEVNFFPKERYV
jgi:hypothetical protein